MHIEDAINQMAADLRVRADAFVVEVRSGGRTRVVLWAAKDHSIELAHLDSVEHLGAFIDGLTAARLAAEKLPKLSAAHSGETQRDDG